MLLSEWCREEAEIGVLLPERGAVALWLLRIAVPPVQITVGIGQQALVTKLDFSPKAVAAAEAKREARLAAKGDVVDVDSAENDPPPAKQREVQKAISKQRTLGKGSDDKAGDKRAADKRGAEPARKGRSQRSGATSAKAAANGSGGNGAARTTTSAVTSGR